MIKLSDQLGNDVVLEHPAKRIVSAVPSQTELLHYLGLEDEVIGITKFCIHPNEWFRSKERVGGTKTLNLEKIRLLQPDLIIANKEENSQSDIEELQQEFPLYLSDIFSFEDAFEMIRDVGTLTGLPEKASILTEQIADQIKTFPRLNGRVLYFMWNEPYMVAGKNTFIGHVLEKIGFENCFSSSDGRYEEISLERIKELDPDYLLLSSEPFPFKQEHAELLKKEINSEVLLVDGEIFSWYGSRMLKMGDYFKELFTYP